MPRQPLNTHEAINAIISVLDSQYPEEELRNNPNLLISEIKTSKINWDSAAKLLNVSKSRLYHWFRETYQKNLKVQMTNDDLALIKDLVWQYVEQDESPDFNTIKSKLSQNYDHQVVYVAFENAKNVVRQRMAKYGERDGKSFVQDAPNFVPTPISKPFIPQLNLTVMQKFESEYNSTRSTMDGSARQRDPYEPVGQASFGNISLCESSLNSSWSNVETTPRLNDFNEFELSDEIHIDYDWSK